MKNSTLVALLAYLEALKEEGFTHIHLGSIMPMNCQMSNLERRKKGLGNWTQFPDIVGNLPEGVFYDRNSGWVYFDEALFNHVIQTNR